MLGFSTQGFYKWQRSPVTRRDYDDAVLINAARDAHHDDPTFGYRFIADELEQKGHMASERRIWRLCSQEQLWSAFAKKKLSMANFKYPLVATRSPHPSSADYFFFDENWPPLERASFIRNDSPLVTTTIP